MRSRRPFWAWVQFQLRSSLCIRWALSLQLLWFEVWNAQRRAQPVVSFLNQYLLELDTLRKIITKFADGHTASNAPDLFRPPKLSGAGPGQYWGGGPPGKSLGCCQLFNLARSDPSLRRSKSILCAQCISPCMAHVGLRGMMGGID